MARESSVIYTQILNYLQATYGQVGQPFYYYFNDQGGNPITPSKTAFTSMVIDVMSWGINLFEQVLDVKKTEFDAFLAEVIYGTKEWMRKKALEFQYGDTPKLDDTDTFQVIYDPVIEANKIIKFASVFNSYELNSLFGGTGLTINAAKGSTPTTLSGPELTAFTDYMALIIPPGIPYTIQTGNADLIRVLADVVFDARYEATIQTDVFDQMRLYLYNLKNQFVVDQLLDFMNNAKGVLSVKLRLISIREDATPYANSTIIFSSIPGATVPLGAVQIWFAKYGYVIEETTAGQDWANTITFTPALP